MNRAAPQVPDRPVRESPPASAETRGWFGPPRVVGGLTRILAAGLDLSPRAVAAQPEPPASTPERVPGLSSDVLTVVLVSAALGILLLLLAYWWWRDRRRRHQYRHRRHPHTPISSPSASPAGEATDGAANAPETAPTERSSPHRRRRRRRAHRGRNPTLAETGGLPPPRPEGQPPPGL